MTVICERCKQVVPNVESRFMQYLKLVRQLDISLFEIEATNPMIYQNAKYLTKRVCEACSAAE